MSDRTVTRERFGKKALEEAIRPIYAEGRGGETKKAPEFEDCDMVYTIFGKHDYLDEGIPVIAAKHTDKNACARFLSVEGTVTYLIRSGDQGGLYHNPIDGMNLSTVHAKQKIKLDYQYLKVNKKTFGFYTKFLTTKNVAWLHNAERESI